MIQVPTPPFQNAVIFSGGGLRFGYYLGLYQALCDNGKKPDIVLASCGGAFVAGLLEASENSQHAFEQMLSHDCYAMLRRISPSPPRHRTDYLLPAMGRWLASQSEQLAKKLPFPTDFLLNKANLLNRHFHTLSEKTLDLLTEQSLAIIDKESENNSFWQFQAVPNPINTVILASQLISANENPQWQLLLRCSHPQLATTLENLNLTNIMADYNPTKIHAHPAIIDDMPLSVAVRASISDMFYLPPLTWQGQQLMGGVLNLTPIELACDLATTVYAETKAGYDKVLAEPAIRSVFGFSPNRRLGDVHDFSPNHSQIHWIDTADNAKQLRPTLAKRLNLRQGYLDVVRPDFATYQMIMKEQFEFGYQRTVQCLDKV